MERAGFFVDVVVSDGATWNRKMWAHFGISFENVSCTHVFDSSRKLWFISDFPHLIKNFRNAITDKKSMLVCILKSFVSYLLCGFAINVAIIV